MKLAVKQIFNTEKKKLNANLYPCTCFKMFAFSILISVKESKFYTLHEISVWYKTYIKYTHIYIEREEEKIRKWVILPHHTRIENCCAAFNTLVFIINTHKDIHETYIFQLLFSSVLIHHI